MRARYHGEAGRCRRRNRLLDREASGTGPTEPPCVVIADSTPACRGLDDRVKQVYFQSIGMAKEGAEDVGAIETARPDNHDRR